MRYVSISHISVTVKFIAFAVGESVDFTNPLMSL